MIQPLRNSQIGLNYLKETENKAGEELIGINNIITPVIVIRDNITQIRTGTSGTLHTTPSDKDFYITNIFWNYVKTAADTGSLMSITVIINGVTVNLIRIGHITGTLGQDSGNETYFQPLKIDRNTAIACSLTGTWTITNQIIKGYTVESNSK